MKSVTQAQQTVKEMSSIRLSHDLKAKLAKVGARLTLEDGKTRSMEDIIKLLLEEYERTHVKEDPYEPHRA
jgi:hypothetical protein